MRADTCDQHCNMYISMYVCVYGARGERLLSDIYETAAPTTKRKVTVVKIYTLTNIYIVQDQSFEIRE